MGIQRWNAAVEIVTYDIFSGRYGVILKMAPDGEVVKHVDHVAHTAALVQALEELIGADGMAYEPFKRRALDKARAALDGQP